MNRGVHAIPFALFDRQVERRVSAGVAKITARGLVTEVAKPGLSGPRQLIEWAAEDTGGRVPPASFCRTGHPSCRVETGGPTVA